MKERASAPHIVILAAGADAKSPTRPLDVLTPVFYRPMIRYVLDAAMAVPHRSIRVVAGADERKMREQCRDCPELRYDVQETPLATMDAFRAIAASLNGEDGDVLILCADRVLLNPAGLNGMLAAHAASGAGFTSASGAGGAYCFRLAELSDALVRLAAGTAQEELPIEHAVPSLAAAGGKAAEYAFADPLEGQGIADLYQLWRVETILRDRHHRALMLGGVALRDPASTALDPRCRIGRDVVIEGGATVLNSVLAEGVYIESGCRVVDSEVAAGSRLKQGSCVEKSRVGRGCVVGPYAHLRPGTQLDDDVRIGNFVELKNASIGTGTKVSHLSYIGDAAVGRNVNVGCGFITCNYDGGPVKQRTIIEDGVFIGSDSQAVAPVTLGAGSFVATGTSVTEDVPPDSFVISRGRQVTKPGYAKKYGRGKTAPARTVP